MKEIATVALNDHRKQNHYELIIYHQMNELRRFRLHQLKFYIVEILLSIVID